MLKKVSHIILSVLIVVSTTGLTYTKHFCKAQLFPNHHLEKAEYAQHAHNQNIAEYKHDSNHVHDHNYPHKQISDDCISDQNCSDDPCCENNTCHDDNCCHDEIQSVKLSLDYIKIETKELFKTFEIELFHTELIVFDNLFNESSIVSRYLITDSPKKIKNTQSILQTFRC